MAPELGEVRAAAEALVAARERLNEAIRAAIAIGASSADVGAAAGLTRQRVWQIVHAPAAPERS